ncbi:unnamed protein product [Lasius platythorax]|uniref:Uncharacterized protein n=1 Tax=Lasius platythorax TaxID=488582 RepID=A0AAV2NPI6_9HYME
MQPDEPQQGTSAQTTVSALREIELLRRERDLAARKTELFRRELELLRMSPRPEKDALVRSSVKKWQAYSQAGITHARYNAIDR